MGTFAVKVFWCTFVMFLVCQGVTLSAQPFEEGTNAEMTPLHRIKRYRYAPPPYVPPDYIDYGPEVTKCKISGILTCRQNWECCSNYCCLVGYPSPNQRYECCDR